MSKQTVQNMKLIILEMKKQVNNYMDFKGVKALSHSYETLLSQLSYNHEDFKSHKLTKDVKSQLNAIEILTNEIESKSIPELLSTGLYLEVNHLTTTTSRLKCVIRGLNDFLENLYKKYNEKVLIVSNDVDKSINKLYKLIENERIIYQQSHLRGYQAIVTDNYFYEAIKYSDNYRGKRVDYVYIDSHLTFEEIDLIKIMLKDKNNYKLF